MVGIELNRALLLELQDRKSPRWREVEVWGEVGPPVIPHPKPQDWEATYLKKQDDRYAELELMVTNKEEAEREEAGGMGGLEAGGGPSNEGDGITGLEQQLIEFLEQEEEQEVAQLLERARVSTEPGQGLSAAQKQVLKVAAQKAKDKKQKHNEEVVRIEGIRRMIQAAVGGRGTGGGSSGSAVSQPGFPRARMPTYNSSGEDRSDYRSHVQAVKTCLSLQKVSAEQEKKQFFFLSFDQKARYRMSATLDPELTEVRGLTFNQYVSKANDLFEPASESEIWKEDFKQLVQKRSESIQDYLQSKSTLYKRAYGSRVASAEHLLEEAIAGVFNSEVRKEIIRSMPKSYEELLAAGLKATGFVRKTGNYARPQEHGLASVSHKETGGRGGAGGGGGTGHLGQLEEGSEEGTEDTEEPLTLGEVQCCLKNETEVETAYWEEQSPDGQLEEVGGGVPSGNFKHLPPGAGCWHCGGDHYKTNCPKRLKIIQKRVGRRERVMRRAAPKSLDYVNCNSRDARKGNFPARQGAAGKGTVGEVGEDEGEDWDEEATLGGLRKDEGF